MSTQARVRTRDLREQQRVAAAREVRRRRIVSVVGAAVVVALLVAIGVAVARSSGGGQAAAPAGPVVAPANVTASSGFVVGDAGAPVSVEVYYDYMCPACGAFEAANGAELDRLIGDGTARVELRPISFLDRQSAGSRYSTRAAAAFATVVHADPGHAWDFHAALYAHQPDEGTSGLGDDRIAELARGVGVPDAVVARFTDGTFEPWVAAATTAAFDGGVEGTPTIRIDGKVFEGNPYAEGPLTEAIESAAGTP